MIKAREPAAPANRITWQVALGLRQPALAGWDRVRDARDADAAGQLPAVCALNMLAALLLIAVLWSSPVRNAVLGWAAGLGLVLGMFMHRARARAPARRGNPMFQSLRRGTLLGLLWVVPSALFAGSATPAQQLAVCLIGAGMMASTAISALALPPGMVASLVIGSFGLSSLIAHAGGRGLLIVLPQIYALVVALGAIASAIATLRRRWSELEIADNREVVSLLLREFEDEDTDWLWQTDAAKALTQVSARLADAAGTTVAALEGQSLPRLVAGDAWEAGRLHPELARLVELLNARESFGELQLPVMIDGEERWWSLSGAPRYAPNGNYLGFRGKGSDVTARRRADDRIDRMAKFDALTGLANRTHFMDQLGKALAQTLRGPADETCVLLLIDLDRFKPVNDTMGHPVGDRLLKLVAERLRNLLHDGEIAGRLGGDEFAMLVRTQIGSDRVEALCAGVIDRLGAPFEIDGHLIRIGASLGSASGPRDGRAVETLVRRADLALYRAKDDGRGCHRRYDPSLLAATNRRRAIEEGLRRALDTGALHLLYQPITDARGGQVRAFEALVRWTDPELGEVPPSAFIPIAEEARLSGRVGEWVLRTACADAAGWPQDVRVSVNLSAEQLGDKQLAATVLSALSHAGLAPARLVLELSESVFLRGGGEVLAVMEALRGIGVGIALDDFGTGHAALAYISSGGIDTIKIDHAIVRGVADGRVESIALVRAVVALAEALGIATVAESIETQAQLDGMVALGCRDVQGHLIGSPLPERSVRSLVGVELRRAS